MLQNDIFVPNDNSNNKIITIIRGNYVLSQSMSSSKTNNNRGARCIPTEFIDRVEEVIHFFSVPRLARKITNPAIPIKGDPNVSIATRAITKEPLHNIFQPLSHTRKCSFCVCLLVREEKTEFKERVLRFDGPKFVQRGFRVRTELFTAIPDIVLKGHGQKNEW